MNRSPLSARLRSFGHALRGGLTLLATQPNARIHAVATLLVLGFGVWTRLSRTEWALLILAMGAVWTAEALNTAVEFLADEVSLEHRERIGKAKDVAAFGVLATALAALAVGSLVFLPHFL